jgi:hypothetical protein
MFWIILAPLMGMEATFGAAFAKIARHAGDGLVRSLTMAGKFDRSVVSRAVNDERELQDLLERLVTDATTKGVVIAFPATDEIIAPIRRDRKDIYLGVVKLTSGVRPPLMYGRGLMAVKRLGINLVMALDVLTGHSIVIGPEQARYHEGAGLESAAFGFGEMIGLRSGLTFTRSTVVEGDPVAWNDPRVPDSLRTAVVHCIEAGAYKPVNGSTVGHFAVKVGEGEFLTSRRKTDFNRLGEVGLVRVQTVGDGRVVAYGSRPSVGGQSQRIVFAEHPDADCILHFHSPLKPGSEVPVREQRPFECGSHECGKNTSGGLGRFDGLYAVMLRGHGPNVVFNRATDPEKVIRFVEDNFDLAGRTDGEVEFPQEAA